MARLRITEYAAKKLYYGDSYLGLSVTPDNIHLLASELKEESYVVKVDVGEKKRSKRGLIELDVPASAVRGVVRDFFSMGFRRALVEPYVEHPQNSELYISVTLTREGFVILYSESGGINVEEGSTDITRFVVPLTKKFDLILINDAVTTLLRSVIRCMKSHQFVFFEINPAVLDDKSLIPLDMAVEIDSVHVHRMPEWFQEHIIAENYVNPISKRIFSLNQRSTASFSLTTLKKNESIFTLLSGGGASLVLFDCFIAAGLQARLANYAEYSGGPTEGETKLFSEIIIEQLITSSAPRKVLVVAGGVANFTNIAHTLSGVAAACEKHRKELSVDSIKIVVRRGGPNQAEGLAKLKEDLKNFNILHSVTGPETSFASVVADVNNFIYEKV